MTAEELEKLKHVVSQMTEGPFAVDIDNRHGGVDQLIENRTGRGLTIAFGTSDGNEYDLVGLCALRNAATALIALAEWAERYHAMFVELDKWADGWCPTQCSCAASARGLFEQLRKAIAAYPEGE